MIDTTTTIVVFFSIVIVGCIAGDWMQKKWDAWRESRRWLSWACQTASCLRCEMTLCEHECHRRLAE